VRPRPVEIRDVLAEHAGELPFPEDEEVIEALAAHAPQEALAHGVGPWRADRRAQHPDPARGGHLREAMPVLAVVVPDQDAGTLVERGGLAPLLRDPGVGRVPRHGDVDRATRTEFDDEEGVQLAEAQVGDR